jgi:hypothetical protein
MAQSLTHEGVNLLNVNDDRKSELHERVATAYEQKHARQTANRLADAARRIVLYRELLVSGGPKFAGRTQAVRLLQANQALLDRHKAENTTGWQVYARRMR